MSVVAPAGYGKTTLLAQWAARERRRFVWVTLDERDDDPAVLLKHIATALGRVEPLEPSVLDLLWDPRTQSSGAAARVGAALFAASRPIVLALDDAHLLRSKESRDALALLVDHVPRGSLLVLSGRVPPLPLARLRASGSVFELGSSELALTVREATTLLHNLGVAVTERDVAGLVRRTEGWPAALYLAGRALLERGPGNGTGRLHDVDAFGGDNRDLADYLRSEYLSRVNPSRLEFLRRSSVLADMCGPLCDAVLARTGSARELASLERCNLLLVPLDRRRDWYRYHHLLRDLLRRELVDSEPELVATLHRRAADWFEENGDPESALEHASAAGDVERAAAILGSVAMPACYSGRIGWVEQWLEAFDDEARLERFPAVALQGSRVHSLRGRPDDALRWLAAAERSKATGPLPDGSRSARPWIAVLRAALCREGPEQMRSDAQSALRALPGTSPWRSSALLVKGIAHVLLGESDRGDELLVDAAETAKRLGSTEPRVVALSERSLLAAAREEHETAERLALEARALVEAAGLAEYPTRAIELAASARAELRHGRWSEARDHLARALRLTPALTHALPWLAVQVRLELARTCVAVRDGDRAHALLAEVDELLRLRPRLGVLATEAKALQRQVDAIPARQEGGGRGLTSAELRLLPLLATHLSFREIGERLYVSRNTVKTQAISVYRKLGVSGRSDAIAAAGELGLLGTAQVG